MSKLLPTEQDNFLWLLGALVALLVSGAVFDQWFGGSGQWLINLSITLVLVVAIWSLDQSRRSRRPRVLVTAILLFLSTAETWYNDASTDRLALILIMLFFAYTVKVAARQVLFTGEIDGNKIVGAIVIYLLIGMLWSFGFLLIEGLQDGAIGGLPYQSWQDNLHTVMYFSFVSLTTLGYGDITPVAPLARFLANIEAIVGHFYIAVLVASLVGARLSHHRS